MLSMYVAAEQKRNPESNLPYRSNEFDVCIHNPEIDFLHPMAQKHLIGPNCGPGRNENIDACTLHNGVKYLRYILFLNLQFQKRCF